MATGIGENMEMIRVSGHEVEFPVKPYGSQMSLICRILQALDGKKNALLESPTGTGKTLALLCASLAWQRKRLKEVEEKKWQDVLLEAERVKTEEGRQIDVKAEFRKVDAISVPTIYFATRTHTQVAQVIKELKRTSYRPKMAILASREQYCVNQKIQSWRNRDEECKKLLEKQGCIYYRQHLRIKMHESLRSGGELEVHDIEDLVTVGRSVRGCPYFASHVLANDADIVFCPYNYIIDPLVRSRMAVKTQNSIIIFDEAHNMEDYSRGACSADYRLERLIDLRTDLQRLKKFVQKKQHYLDLLSSVNDIIAWTQDTEKILKPEGQYGNRWQMIFQGEKISAALNGMGLSNSDFRAFKDNCDKAIADLNEYENTANSEKHAPRRNTDMAERSVLSRSSGGLLESFVLIIGYLFKDKNKHIKDYALRVSKYQYRDRTSGFDKAQVEINIWCLSPAIIFSEIAEHTHSIILTSGTLSPMDSFASELGTEFHVKLEAPHVINIQSQVRAVAITRGPDRIVLNATYKNASNPKFLDSLGKAILGYCEVIPHGILVFFPSYRMIETLMERWGRSDLLNKLRGHKEVILEPKGKDDFEKAMIGYYQAVKIKGALLLAVCRGKVSEGIDFSNENARCVIVVGLPLPNIKDAQVALKKSYNTKFQSKGLLEGEKWYQQQAYRALNQAVGRCIRHKQDWGCIVLLDERFSKQSTTQQLSKWVRSAVLQSNFDSSIEEIKRFVRYNSMNSVPDSKTEDDRPQIVAPVASHLKLSESDGVVTSSTPDFSRQCGQVYENNNEDIPLSADDVNEVGRKACPEDVKKVELGDSNAYNHESIRQVSSKSLSTNLLRNNGLCHSETRIENAFQPVSKTAHRNEDRNAFNEAKADSSNSTMYLIKCCNAKACTSTLFSQCSNKREIKSSAVFPSSQGEATSRPIFIALDIDEGCICRGIANSNFLAYFGLKKSQNMPGTYDPALRLTLIPMRCPTCRFAFGYKAIPAIGCKIFVRNTILLWPDRAAITVKEKDADQAVETLSNEIETENVSPRKQCNRTKLRSDYDLDSGPVDMDEGDIILEESVVDGGRRDNKRRKS